MVSGGFIAALVVMALIIAIMAFFVWLLHGEETHEYGMLTETAFARRLIVGVCLTFLMLFTAGLFPYEREYHWYVSHTETVVAKDASTFNVNEDNNFRIELANGVVFRSNDYRFQTVQVGDIISVNCIKRWDYSATDGYDCRFAGFQE